jgi:hypothetical protein
VFLATTTVQSPAASPARPGKPGKWEKLYNSKDLQGWHTEGDRAKLESWSPDGEVLACKGGGMGYLATDKEYGDFELKLEYRLASGTNSGIGVRFPRGKWPSTDGMEIQLLDDAAPKNKDTKPKELCGAIYSFIAPKPHPSKPAGGWNQLRIRCEGPEIVVWINNVEVIHENLDTHDEKGKGDLPLSKRPRTGLIGLQCHYDPIDFRKIEVREIK